MTATDAHIVAMPGFTFIIRIAILVLSVIILGLAANSVSADNSDYTDYTSSFDTSGIDLSGLLGGLRKRSSGYSALDTGSMGFVLFVAIFSLLGNSYLIITPLFFPFLYNMWAHLVFEVLSWVFWLSAFAVAGATAGASAKFYKAYKGKVFSWWATAAAAAGLGALVWILHLIVGVIFCMRLHRHRTDPNNAGLSPYGVAEKHEMNDVVSQPPPQQQPVTQEYPAPTQTPSTYVTTPPPPQWQQSPPPIHPQGGQGGQY